MKKEMSYSVWMCKMLGIKFRLFAIIDSKWTPTNKFVGDDTDYCLVMCSFTDQFAASIAITAGLNTFQRGFKPEMKSYSLHKGSIIKLKVNQDIIDDFTETAEYNRGNVDGFRSFLLKYLDVSYIEAFVNKKSVGSINNKRRLIVNN